MTIQPYEMHPDQLKKASLEIEQQAQKRFQERTESRKQTFKALESSPLTEVDEESRVRRRLASIPEDDGLALERIIHNNDLFPIAYLEQGINVARSVCRIELCDRVGRVLGHGTGFLVSPNLLLTNNHVLESPSWALYAQAEFNYQKDVNRYPLQSKRFNLNPKRFFITDAELDFTLVALDPHGQDGATLSEFGYLKLISESGKALKGEYVSIIQHPGGGFKAVAIRENEVIDVFDQFIHYLTDTQKGSSGSAVCNDAWEVVALHHSGVRDPNAPDKFIANEGIRISSIMSFLQDKRKNLSVDQKQLLDEILYESSPAVSLDTSSQEMVVGESSLEWYKEDNGYNEHFLGITVPLPTLRQDLQDDVAKLKDGSELLHYTHFSIKMNAPRRLAFYTAVNIDGSKRVSVRRQNDHWYFDKRLDQKYQSGPDLYKHNPIDRGHLVRRLAPVWGTEAQEANRDTFHFTNCAPQHKGLNQKTWLDLENYILQNAAKYDMKVSVFTGPIFRDDDMLYRSEFQIPAEFWKVVATVVDNRLSATAYLQTQKNLISDLEFAFGSYQTYQVQVARIEKLTGLDFGDLQDHDPLYLLEGIMGRPILEAADIRL